MFPLSASLCITVYLKRVRKSRGFSSLFTYS